jgi:hypothetical protein
MLLPEKTRNGKHQWKQYETRKHCVLLSAACFSRPAVCSENLPLVTIEQLRNPPRMVKRAVAFPIQQERKKAEVASSVSEIASAMAGAAFREHGQQGSSKTAR